LSYHQKGGVKLKQASHNASQSSNNILNLFEKQSMVGNEANDPLTGNDVKDTVLDFFIAGNIPFNQADSPEFQCLISMIKVKGKAVNINRKNLRSRLAEQAAIAKKDLMDELAANVSRVSLAMDGWTSRLNNAYLGMSLVAHK